MNDTTTTENKKIDLDGGLAEKVETAYRKEIKANLISQWPDILAEQPELIQKLLADEYIKDRFIEVLTEQVLEKAKEETRFTGTIKSRGGSDNIW